MQQVPQFRKAGSRSQTIPGTETPEVQLYLEKRAARDEAQAELDEAEVAVVAQAREKWLAFNRNQAEPLSTVTMGGAKITFSAQYKTVDVLPDPLRERQLEFVIGDGSVEDPAWYAAFRKLRVDFPGAQAEIHLDVTLVADKTGFQVRLGELMKKFPGLDVAISDKQVAVRDFAIRRHRDLTIKENLELEAKGLGTKVAVKLA